MQSAPDLGSMERHAEPMYTPGRAQQAGVLLAHYSVAEATSDTTHSACASWQQVDSTDLLASTTSSVPTADALQPPSWNVPPPWPTYDAHSIPMPPHLSEGEMFPGEAMMPHTHSWFPPMPPQSAPPLHQTTTTNLLQHFQEAWDR
eukprot:4302012-Amphidinium_carterae.1